MYQYAIKNVYQAREVIEVEAMGYKVLGELIHFFMEWVNHPSSGQSQKIAIMLQGTGVPRNNGGKAARLAHMLDYISGMTDSFALENLPEVDRTCNFRFLFFRRPEASSKLQIHLSIFLVSPDGYG